MSTREVRLLRYELGGSGFIERDDVVAADRAICVFINGEFYRTLIATPEMTEELVVGHLVCEGIIEGLDDVVGVEMDPLRVNVELQESVDLDLLNMSKVDIITTACGSLGMPVRAGQLERLVNGSDVSVDAGKVMEMIRELNARSSVYRATGGTHSAMLCSDAGEVYAFAEDVGRHNAVDKVVGAGLMKRVDLSGCVLLSSGRQSSEIVLKVARSGVPVVASVSGPLESGINVARETGVTLICFARGKRMNVYTYPERITGL
ncbi:Formate dehydrogenase, subunit FdhD [Thaumarchaeota archaeon SCGC AB-539-E09]|nr:Formate dehydrogenase, subunit FdhD [Thaumarchaeota archaeon SCGC AB-539-E09]